MPAIPSCTVAGRFGIERTTGTPEPIRLSIADVGIAAATDSTVCSGVSRPPISPSRTSKSCGLTAITTSAAPAIASAFEVPAVTPYGEPSSAARVAAEPLHADDADRPGPEPARTLKPVRGRGGRLRAEALEVERAAEPDQRRASAGAEAEAPQLRRRKRGEGGRRGRRVQPGG